MKSPASHSTAWYGPVPTIGGLVREEAFGLRVLDLLDRVLAPDVLGQDRHVRLRQERGREGGRDDERLPLAGASTESPALVR